MQTNIHTFIFHFFVPRSEERRPFRPSRGPASDCHSDAEHCTDPGLDVTQGHLPEDSLEAKKTTLRRKSMFSRLTFLSLATNKRQCGFPAEHGGQIIQYVLTNPFLKEFQDQRTCQQVWERNEALWRVAKARSRKKEHLR